MPTLRIHPAPIVQKGINGNKTYRYRFSKCIFLFIYFLKFHNVIAEPRCFKSAHWECHWPRPWVLKLFRWRIAKWNLPFVMCHYYLSQWPRVLRRTSCGRSPAEIVSSNPNGGHGCLSVVSVVCCQVEVSATDWSLVQTSPTDCGASLCVIKKPRKRGG